MCPAYPSHLLPSMYQHFFCHMQVDCTDHLDHIAKLQLYEYQFDKGLSASGSGMVGQQPVRRHVGLLAQEVKEIIPDAVKETVSGKRK